MKKTKQKKNPLTILIVAVVLLFVAVGINGAATIYLLHKDSEDDDRQLATLIVDGATGMNRPLVRDASGKQYIPEAKLMLPPAGTGLGQVLYQYTPQINGFEEELHLANEDNIRTAASSLLKAEPGTKHTFVGTPTLQACARGIHVTFSAQEGQTPAATKALANGKTAYFYTEAACEDEDFLQYVQQLQSY